MRETASAIEINPVLRRAGAVLRRKRPLLQYDWTATIRREPAFDLKLGGHDLSLLFFRSSGCRFSKAGECTMCDYQIAAPMQIDAMVGNVARALDAAPDHDALFVAPLGSMFDDREVPLEARRRIYVRVAAVDCRLVASETRMEFLTEETVGEFAAAFPNRLLRINIGLESTDPWVLANSVGKAIPVSALAEKAALLHRHGVDLACNILLGSAVLTPREALESAIRSVEEAIEAGAALCVLFPANVRRWTVQHWLWKQGLFAPPSLWALVEAVWRLHGAHPGRVALSYFDKKLNQSIAAMPTACPRCETAVKQALWGFAASGAVEAIERVRTEGCACRDDWLRTLEAPQEPPSARAWDVFQHLGPAVCGADWWPRYHETVRRIAFETPGRPLAPRAAADGASAA